MRNKVTYIFRKRLPQYHSIEELFQNVSGQLTNSYKIETKEMPESGATLRSILKNLGSLTKDSDTIYHVTGDVNYVCLKLGKATVLTVHDVRSALTGNWVKKLLIRWIWFKWPASRVGAITVISEFTRDELAKIIPRNAYKIRVISNPVNRDIQPDPKFVFNPQRPRVLLLGTKSNKNLERTLEALKGLELELLIIGKLTKEQFSLLHNYKFEYENHISLSFEKVIDCYRRSDLLCFASLYEGFGMPIIEAQGIGRPVITSNVGAMKEVAKNSACLVDPLDVITIRKAVKKVISNEDYRNNLIALGFKNVKRFQLDTVAQQYAAVYKDVSNE